MRVLVIGLRPRIVELDPVKSVIVEAMSEQWEDATAIGRRALLEQAPTVHLLGLREMGIVARRQHEATKGPPVITIHYRLRWRAIRFDRN